MVAYSFKPSFARQVEQLTKLQTIRLPRKRHARPGEPLQLYAGMRTRACRKLVDPDPICRAVNPIKIHMVGSVIILIEIGPVPIDDRDQLEQFARDDGFDPKYWHSPQTMPPGITALKLMGRWWRDTHGLERFEGVLIQWETTNAR